MAMSTDVYRTQFASALKYYYPNEVMQELCYRRENILQYLNKIKAPGGGRQDMWGVNTYPPDDSRTLPTSATALITPTAEQFTDAYVTLKTRYTRRFINHDVLDDAATNRTALIKAVNYYPTKIAQEHAFKNARALWQTGGSYPGALGKCAVTSASYVVNMDSNFNFNNIFRGMKVDFRNTYGTLETNADSLTISDYSETNCTITVATTAITTTATTRICIEDECYDNASTWGTYAWNSIPKLVGEGNVCNVTVSSYPEYKSRIYTSIGTLSPSDLQTAVNWVEGHSEGNLNAMHVSPQLTIKYADIFLGDVRIPHTALAGELAMGYPEKLAYRGGSMGKIPIEKDHLMPLDEIYMVNWDSLKFFNSAWMKWFDKDGSIFAREQGYMNYELLFYTRGELAIFNRIGCAALTGILV